MASWILYSVSVFLLIHYVCSNEVKLKADTTDVMVKGKLQLMCSQAKPELAEHWIIKRREPGSGSAPAKLQMLLKTDPLESFVDSSVSHWKYKIEKSGLVVTIEQVHCNDNGTYVCSVVNKSNTTSFESDDLEVVVKAPPEQVEIRSNFAVLDKKEIESTVGKQIHLICKSFIGNPPGIPKWFISDNVDDPNSFKAVTVNVSGSDSEPEGHSCQSIKRISLKYYPDKERKVAIKCGVSNSVGEDSLMKIFNIKESMDADKKDSSKLIIIVVLCVIIPEIIIAIILGVVLYIRRSRAKKKREMEAAAEAVIGTYKPAEKAQQELQQSNNIPLNKMSSVGGRRNRSSRHDNNDQEKQPMTGAAKA